MFNLGFQEILVILLVALIFLGPKMLPDIASGLGKAIREVRKAASDVRNQIELDETIRKPLQELREATLLPPEELKRRDEEKAAQREEEARKRTEAQRQENLNKALGEEGQAATRAESQAVEAPKTGSPPREPTLVMNPPPDHNLPPFTPHPQALKPSALAVKAKAAAASAPVPAPSAEPPSDATVMDLPPAQPPTPTPTVVAPLPELASPGPEPGPAPRDSASLPAVGLPPSPAARRPGLKIPPPLPLPRSFKKD